MGLKKTADVVIIGGGIAGISLLYYLTEQGICNVRLVEMEQIGSGSTGRSAAWVMHQQFLELNSRLTLLSMSEYIHFNEKFGVDIALSQPGVLQIGTAEMKEEMLARSLQYKALGIPVNILDKPEVLKMAPFLEGDIGLGLYCEEDGRVDPHPIIQAYAKASKERGAIIEEGITATNIAVNNGRVVGVETTDGFISTPIVVNAAGYRADEVGRWVGIDLPLYNSINHELILKSTMDYEHSFPLLQILHPEPIYVASYPNQNFFSVGIGEWAAENFKQEPDLSRLMDEFGHALSYRLKGFDNLQIMDYWAGIRPLNPDGYPILGPVNELSGYINDCCWGGKGVAHGAAGGILLSKYIAGVDDMPLEIEPFLLSRFQDGTHKKKSVDEQKTLF